MGFCGLLRVFVAFCGFVAFLPFRTYARLSAVNSQHLIADGVKMMLKNKVLIQKIFGKDDNPSCSSVRVNTLHLCSCNECIGRKRCRKPGIKVRTPFQYFTAAPRRAYFEQDDSCGKWSTTAPCRSNTREFYEWILEGT